MFDIVEMQLGSNVADAGTFTVSYPTGRDAGDYTGGTNNLIQSRAYGELKNNVSFSFGTANITVTNNTGQTMLSGTDLYVQLDRIGADDGENPTLANDGAMAFTPVVTVNLGAPDVADVNGVFEAVSQAAGAITLDGALLVGSEVVFDVPRNIVVDSGGADTSPIVFTGEDEYGNVMVESITLNGTTAVAGKKAFKKITGAANSATISNGAFAGPGDVLGLPMFLPQTGQVIAENEDGAAATAGTIVAGVKGTATATTGDVRGTYDPNSAADGAKSFQLIVALGDPADKGSAQYTG